MFLSLDSHAPVESSTALVPRHVHEVQGASRRAFAARVAADLIGPVLWIAPGHGDADGRRLNPNGLSAFFDPARVVLVLCPDVKTILQAGEDALRSGSVPLVVLDLPVRPGLTPGRRLNLAAETGKSTGLMLVPETRSGAMTAWTVRRVIPCAERSRWQETVMRDRSRGVAAEPMVQ